MGYPEAQYAIDGSLENIKNLQQVGLPIYNMDFTVIAPGTGGGVQVYFKVEDLIIKDVLLSRFKELTIVCKKSTPPENIEDGILVGTFDRNAMNIYVDTPYIWDTKLDANSTYYFRPYIQTENNVTASMRSLIREIIIGDQMIFGFHQDFTNLDPDESITYIGLNKNYTPMHTNVDTGEHTLGTWSSWNWLNQNRVYMLGSSGEPLYEIDPNDYSKTIDGNAVDLSNYVAGELGVYAWIPKIYTKEVYSEDGNSRDVYYSVDNTHDDTKDFTTYVFKDRDGNEINGFWMPVFPLTSNTVDYSNESTRKVSAFSKNSNPMYDKTIGDSYISKYIPQATTGALFENRIRIEYGISTPLACFIRDLTYLLFKSTNIHKHAGHGYNGSATKNTFIIPEESFKHGAFLGYNGLREGKLFHSFVLGSYPSNMSEGYSVYRYIEYIYKISQQVSDSGIHYHGVDIAYYTTAFGTSKITKTVINMLDEVSYNDPEKGYYPEGVGYKSKLFKTEDMPYSILWPYVTANSSGNKGSTTTGLCTRLNHKPLNFVYGTYTIHCVLQVMGTKTSLIQNDELTIASLVDSTYNNDQNRFFALLLLPPSSDYAP